jgi:hypothetical protein
MAIYRQLFLTFDCSLASAARCRITFAAAGKLRAKESSDRECSNDISEQESNTEGVQVLVRYPSSNRQYRERGETYEPKHEDYAFHSDK